MSPFPRFSFASVCCFLLLVTGAFSLSAQDLPHYSVLDISGFPFPAEIKSVRLIDQQFSIVYEEYESDDEYWENDADTIYKDIADYVPERRADTLYDPYVRSQFSIDPKGYRTSYMTEQYNSPDTSWTDADGTHYRESDGPGGTEQIITRYNNNGTVKSDLFISDEYGKRLFEYTYDHKKRLIKTEETAPYFTSVEERTYDKKGRCTRYTGSTTRSGETTKVDWDITYEYTKQGRLARKIRTIPSASENAEQIDTTVYEYDEAGRVSRMQETGKPGKKCRTFIYSYTTQGLLSRITYEYKAQYTNVITGEINFEYDRYNQCISKIETSHIGKGPGPYNVQEYWSITYDEKGLPLRCVHTVKRKLKEDVRIYTWEYEYR